METNRRNILKGFLGGLASIPFLNKRAAISETIKPEHPEAEVQIEKIRDIGCNARPVYIEHDIDYVYKLFKLDNNIFVDTGTPLFFKDKTKNIVTTYQGLNEFAGICDHGYVTDGIDGKPKVLVCVIAPLKVR